MPVFKWANEQIVNTTTAGDQYNASVSGLADGGYVVAWQGPDANGSAVFAQRYDAFGAKVDGEINVSALFGPAVRGFDPHVAGTSDGGLAFTFTYLDTTGGNTAADVIEVVLDSSQNVVSAWLADNNIDESESEVVATSTGRALVYTEAGSDVRFAYQGLGETYTYVNVAFDTAGVQKSGDVAQLTGGRYVVTWWDETQSRLEARIFDADGVTAVGASATADIVITTGFGADWDTNVVALSNGAFLVAWESDERSIPTPTA